MYTDRPRYRELRSDDDAWSDLDYAEPPRRRSKGFSVMFTVACIIALGLAASFYHAAKSMFVPEFEPDSPKSVRKALKKSDIITGVIDDFTPAYSLSVTWTDESHHAKLGNTLSPEDLQSAPQVYITDPPDGSSSAHSGASSLKNVVLAMTDPDAPSHDDPKWSEFCHWIATGVSYVDVLPARRALAKKPKDLTDVLSYRAPGPPPKTGKHRYVFLAFAPSNGTSAPLNLVAPEERRGWGVREWADEMGLYPLAANFIYAKNKKQ